MDGRNHDRPRPFWPRGRVRRPSDAARLLAVVGLLLLLALLSTLVPRLGDAALSRVHGLPRTVLEVANAVSSLAVLLSLGAVVATAVRRRRYALTSAAIACALGAAVAIAAQEAGEAGWVASLGPARESAVVPVAATLAFVVGADLRWGRRLQEATYTAVAIASACALVLGSLTIAGSVAAALLGTAAGLAVRVAAGVVPARPPQDLVRTVLARAGIVVDRLRPLDQATGRARYSGADASGDLVITVIDPDRRGVALAHRVWRVLRFRTPAVGRPALTLRGVTERQALVAGLARSAGVDVPAVLALLAAGPALVLVQRPLDGTRLADAAEPGPAALASAFRALRRMHGAGLTHGALSADTIVLTAGGAGFTGLQFAQPAAGELQRDLDVVALLVAVAARVGAEGSVEALHAGYAGTSVDQARLVPLVQPLGLTRAARRAVRGTTVLDDLRVALSGKDSPAPVAAPRLQRIRARTVLAVAGATVGAHVLFTQLSDVSIGSAVRQAQPAWLAIALLGSAVTYLGAALVLSAFSPTRLPLGRTALVQLASSFVTLVTPPTVGHIGLNIRYLQRAGVPTATAAATVGVSQAVTVVVTVGMLLACGWLSGVSPSRPSLLPSGDVLAVLLVAAAVLGLAVAVPASRHALYRRLQPLVRRTVPQLLAAATDRRRLGTAALGVLILNGGNVLALDASLRAFSTSLALPSLVVVYLVASTVGSAAPTPGGLGAVEAALVGGLTTTGVPVAAALTAVLAFRTATFWLPAPVGWIALVALQRRERI
jgi:uncharacterized membrane protein YbhN (UPF0104 family)/tRNA A-37 threonylcarbamoyl transferase component Bud32